jgi:uncharacterized membrane protein
MQTLFPNSLADLLALSLTAAGVFVFIFGIMFIKKVNDIIPLSLDFWLAAGLLRLSGSPDWRTLASAASIIIVRKLVTVAFNRRSASNVYRT